MTQDTLAASTGEPDARLPAYEPYTALGPLEEKLEHYLFRSSPYHFDRARVEKFLPMFPWIAILAIPFSILSLIFAVGLAALATLTGDPMGLVQLGLTIAGIALSVLAIPGLFRRTRKGWTFFVYEVLVMAVGSLLSFDLFGVAMTVFVLWLAFQHKYHYA